ncbi:hypothetical protein ACTVPT_23475 [Serratia bockelmannii]|uniref:hypothetical protein n=1 Tax=Serratia TaxID=613 RepID=UPI00146DBD3F|nr:hypothetical protein [Serratia marcescens]NMT26715.1 hypothetical protein [Serratia marcescens]
MTTDLIFTVIKVYEYQSESDVNNKDVNVLYLVIDTISGSVISHFSEKNLAYETCYELNFPQIIEYKSFPKNNEYGAYFKLEEITQEKNDSEENINLPVKATKEEISEFISDFLKKLRCGSKFRM